MQSSSSLALASLSYKCTVKYGDYPVSIEPYGVLLEYYGYICTNLEYDAKLPTAYLLRIVCTLIIPMVGRQPVLTMITSSLSINNNSYFEILSQPHDLFYQCWRLQDCFTCLHSSFACSWCAIV